MSQSHLHQLMCEIGPALDLDEVIEQAGHAVWVLAFPEGAVIEAEYDEAGGGRLLLSMELGEPEPGAAADWHRVLLQYNALWRQTGGVRMALSGTVVVQALELAVPGLTLPVLADALSGLRTHAVLWRALLASDGPAGPPGGDAPLDLGTLRA